MEQEKVYYFYTLHSTKSPDEVRYVGVTTQSLQQRLSEHRYKAKSEKFRTQPVHKWMHSHYQQGFDIIIKILDQCDATIWQEKEKYWIKYYKDVGAKLLNLQLGGSGVYTSEMRAIEGRLRSKIAHQIPVACYDKQTGEEIMRFSSGVEAANYFHVDKSTIHSVLDKPNRSSCGYKWRRLPKFSVVSHVPLRNSQYNKRIEVYQYDLTGTFIKKFMSVRQVYREFLGKSKIASTSQFTKSILDANKIWHGFLWYSSLTEIDFRKVYKYAIVNTDGVEIERFVSMNAVARYLCIDSTTVSQHIKNQKLIKNIQIIKY